MLGYLGIFVYLLGVIRVINMLNVLLSNLAIHLPPKNLAKALRSRQGLNPAMIQKCFEEFKTSGGLVSRAAARGSACQSPWVMEREEIKRQDITWKKQIKKVYDFICIDLIQYIWKQAGNTCHQTKHCDSYVSFLHHPEYFGLSLNKGLFHPVQNLLPAVAISEARSLRKKHGNLIRAWRQELSTNDAMSWLSSGEVDK